MTTATNWKTEFGKSFEVPACLTEAAGVQDKSWNQDAAPSFWVGAAKNGNRVEIWAHHPDKSLREFEQKHFVLIISNIDETGESLIGDGCTIAESDDCSDILKQAKVAALALDFSAILASWMAPDKQKQVIDLNKAETDSRICHSHDFCDPNQAMIDALELHGMELDIQSDEQNALCDAAWTLAKANGFWFISSI